jgi:hypothetical protein
MIKVFGEIANLAGAELIPRACRNRSAYIYEAVAILFLPFSETILVVRRLRL